MRAVGGDAASGPGRHSESLETGKGPRLTLLLQQRCASPAPAAVKALVWPRSRVSVLAVLGSPPVSWHLGQGQKPTQWSGSYLGPSGVRVPVMLTGPSQ